MPDQTLATLVGIFLLTYCGECRSIPNSEIEATFSQDTEAPNLEDYFIMSPANARSIQNMLDFEIYQGTRGCVERTDMDHLPSSIPLGDCNPCEGTLVIAATVSENGMIKQKYYNIFTVPAKHNVYTGFGIFALIVTGLTGTGYLLYRIHEKNRVRVQAQVRSLQAGCNVDDEQEVRPATPGWRLEEEENTARDRQDGTHALTGGAGAGQALPFPPTSSRPVVLPAPRQDDLPTPRPPGTDGGP